MPLGVFIPARAEDLSLSFASGVDSAAQGAVLYRNASSRYAALAAGTSGQFLTSGGPAADPAWQSLSAADLSPAVILAPTTSVRNVIQPTDAAVVPLTVKGFAGQTARLTEWQDSAGTILGGVGPAGNLGLGVDPHNTHRLLAVSGAAANKAIVARGFAGQTASLIEVQASSSAVLAAIGPLGNAGLGTTFAATTQLFMLIGDPANKGAVIRAAAAQTANLEEWQSSSSVVLSSVGPQGNFGIGAAVLSTTRAFIIPGDVAHKGMVVRGIASQTANLIEGQNSSSQVLYSVGPSGIVTSLLADATTAVITDSVIVDHTSSGTPAAGFGQAVRFKGKSSTTGSRNMGLLSAAWVVAADGTRTARLVVSASDATADRECARFETDGAQGLVGFGGAVGSSTLAQFTVPSAAYRGIVVKGAASQTGALTEWQDSAAAIVAQMNADGRLGLGAAASATARLLATITVAANMGVVIKSAASQTGNLIETQDSAGATTGFFRVLAGGVASGPGAGASSERFGSGSLAAGANATAFGNTASASGVSGAAFGGFTGASNSNTTALGTSAMATGVTATACGAAATASGASSCAFGGSAVANQGSALAFGTGAQATASLATAIGVSATCGHAQSFAFGQGSATTAANQFVVGSSQCLTTDYYLGRGIVDAAPPAITIQPTGGSGTDIAGGNFILAGGKGTGSGKGGDLIFQATIAGASATTLRTLQEKLRMVNTGVLRYSQESSVQTRTVMETAATFATATDATRKGRAVWSVFDTAAREGFRIEADGTNPMIGFLGAAAVVRQTLGAAATDAATTQTLANNLRTALINLGLGQT